MTGDYQGAIKDMDILLAAHEGDLSFYMDDLLKKGNFWLIPRSPVPVYLSIIRIYRRKTR